MKWQYVPQKGTSWVFNTFHEKFHAYKCSRVEVLVQNRKKKKLFHIFHNYGKTIYIQWPHDPQKAQLEHKAHICA